MIYVLDCGHQFQGEVDDIELGDRMLCDLCPETIRSNESRTASWSVGHPSRRVIRRQAS